jgi:hypothetical protein
MKGKLIIETEGGVVTSVYTDLSALDLEIHILDNEDLEEQDERALDTNALLEGGGFKCLY